LKSSSQLASWLGSCGALIINTSTQSRDIYGVQPKCNKASKLLALYILKHLPKNILCEEPDFLSIKSNEAISDYGPCMECDTPILAEDPPRSNALIRMKTVIRIIQKKNPDFVWIDLDLYLGQIIQMETRNRIGLIYKIF
jgi:hypothetical protein